MSDTLDLRTALPEKIASHHRPRADLVTSIIEHEVKAGRETEYETWLKKIAPIAARFPGHQGVSFVRPSPGSNKYTVLLKFDTFETSSNVNYIQRRAKHSWRKSNLILSKMRTLMSKRD